jgi:hypothetical protein
MKEGATAFWLIFQHGSMRGGNEGVLSRVAAVIHRAKNSQGVSWTKRELVWRHTCIA